MPVEIAIRCWDESVWEDLFPGIDQPGRGAKHEIARGVVIECLSERSQTGGPDPSTAEPGLAPAIELVASFSAVADSTSYVPTLGSFLYEALKARPEATIAIDGRTVEQHVQEGRINRGLHEAIWRTR